jgi:hypothetical protein
MEIPPPAFRTIECQLQCCVCSENCVLYWLKDDVWKQLQPAATCCGGHVCVRCAEEYLKRSLTLDDLSIENYLRTANNGRGNSRSIIHCVVDTVMGAANQAGVSIPFQWCYMWEQYHDLGKKLASQTPNAAQVVAGLIEKTMRYFPNFSNPYLTPVSAG